MTSYVDVFSGSTIPPSGLAYQDVDLTGNVTATWPYNSIGGFVVAKVNDIDASGAYTITMPPADQVSNGEDSLWTNNSAYVITFNKSDGTTLATVAVGGSLLIYVVDNTTNSWGFINYGSSPSSASNAAALAGYGMVAVGSKLNTAFGITTLSGTATINATHLSVMIKYTGSTSGLVYLVSPATLGSGFYCSFHNAASVTATLSPTLGTIDGSAAFQVQPGESLTLVCDGTNFYTVGYGRSTAYQFTEQVVNLTTLGYTLSAVQASSKMLKFTGAPSSNVSIGIPGLAAAFYILNTTSKYLVFSTGVVNSTTGVITGGGVQATLAPGASTTVLCDGTDCSLAVSTSTYVNTQISVQDGMVGTPSINFSAETNTGFYRAGAGLLGVAIGGANVGSFTSTGWHSTDMTLTGTLTGAIGNFTTLTASSAVSGAGFNALFASPPAIGSVAPAAGSFTVGNFTGAVTAASLAGGASTGAGSSGTWGINITGNSASVTNGVYNNGGTYGINISGNAASVTNGVYNTGGTYNINITGTSANANALGGVAASSYAQSSGTIGSAGQTYSGNMYGTTRTINTTYTNSTGRPIHVYIGEHDPGGQWAYLYVNGALAGQCGGGYYTSMSAIVPNGGTYSCSGTTYVVTWFELR